MQRRLRKIISPVMLSAALILAAPLACAQAAELGPPGAVGPGEGAAQGGTYFYAEIESGDDGYVTPPTTVVFSTPAPTASPGASPTPTPAVRGGPTTPVPVRPTAAPVQTEENPGPETESEQAELMAFYSGDGSAWALVNLLCAIVSVIEGVIAAVLSFKRRFRRRFGVLSLGLAVISGVVFILTEDLSRTMCWIDRRTLLMAVLLAVDTVLSLWAVRKKRDDEDDEHDGQERETSENSL